MFGCGGHGFAVKILSGLPIGFNWLLTGYTNLLVFLSEWYHRHGFRDLYFRVLRLMGLLIVRFVLLRGLGIIGAEKDTPDKHFLDMLSCSSSQQP